MSAIAKNLMAEMKLLGMFAAYDQAVTDATRDQTGYSEFLDTLLQAECDYRQERKTGYRIKAAKFTLRPAFEDIDFTASRSISKAQIKELYSLQWLNEARPVLLIGQTGTGKNTWPQPSRGKPSSPANALASSAWVNLVNHLDAEKRSGRAGRLATLLLYQSAIVLDELGYSPFPRMVPHRCST
jgi:hypothetical protein